MENGCGGHCSDGCKELQNNKDLLSEDLIGVRYKGLMIHNDGHDLMKGDDIEDRRVDDLSGR